MDYIKVEGCEDLVRDPHTLAIINKNDIEYKNYLRVKEAARAKKQQIYNQAQEIESLKQEISDIKNLLNELLKVSRNADATSANNNT